MNAKVIPVPIEEEMKSAYIDYAMSVIVARALPDVRDGLKPVQRRVLYGMYELGLLHNRPHRKSARIVGEVLGKYHPHGDAPVYEAMVRMAQDWVLRYPLIDGQGNFGSIDGDGPAAMRYTEARLSRIAEELLVDIDKDTVDFQPNFDESLEEPVVLPARFPNLLANGASGIAVGMATSVMPHNLSELVDGMVAWIRNPEISLDELMQYIPGPDFPTGGEIVGTAGIRKAYETGKGYVVVRGKVQVETYRKGQRVRLVITEIPYQTTKAGIIMKIASLVEAEKLQGIEDIRDESDRRGMRVVIELKPGVNPDVVLKNLYRHTPLQTRISIQQIVLVRGRPRQLSLKELIAEYIRHRHEVLLRKSRFELRKAEERAHILEGLLKALQFIDQVIQIIRTSEDPPQARNRLMHALQLTEKQAQAILDMRLQRLTSLERHRLQEEHQQIQERIAYLRKLMEDEQMQKETLIQELQELKQKYGDERRTRIIREELQEVHEEELILERDMVIFLTEQGYIKATELASYRRQRRGGKGVAGISLREDDAVLQVWFASSRDRLLLFTNRGRVFVLPAYQVPEGGRGARGKPLRHLLSLQEGEKVVAGFPIPQAFLHSPDHHDIFFLTEKGMVKRTPLHEFRNIRSSGIRAIDLEGDNQLVGAFLTREGSEIVMFTENGQGIRFPVEAVRPMGRNARGVRGIRLSPGDHVIGGGAFLTPQAEHLYVLTVTRRGLAKKTRVTEIRKTDRGGKGVLIHRLSEKTGKLAGAILIHGENTDAELLVLTRSGQVIRISVKDVRESGRATQGVRLIHLQPGEEVRGVVLLTDLRESLQERGLLFPAESSPSSSSSPKPAGSNGTLFASSSS